MYYCYIAVFLNPYEGEKHMLFYSSSSFGRVVTVHCYINRLEISNKTFPMSLLFIHFRCELTDKTAR